MIGEGVEVGNQAACVPDNVSLVDHIRFLQLSMVEYENALSEFERLTDKLFGCKVAEAVPKAPTTVADPVSIISALEYSAARMQSLNSKMHRLLVRLEDGTGNM